MSTLTGQDDFRMTGHGPLPASSPDVGVSRAIRVLPSVTRRSSVSPSHSPNRKALAAKAKAPSPSSSPPPPPPPLLLRPAGSCSAGSPPSSFRWSIVDCPMAISFTCRAMQRDARTMTTRRKSARRAGHITVPRRSKTTLRLTITAYVAPSVRCRRRRRKDA